MDRVNREVNSVSNGVIFSAYFNVTLGSEILLGPHLDEVTI